MNIVLYILVLIAYWRYIFYHLQLTELYNNAVYVFNLLTLPVGDYK